MDKNLMKTEWSEKFESIRKGMMEIGFHRFGPISSNYGAHRMNAIAALKNKLAEYERTGNTEMLADVANFAMIEFMYPQHENGHYYRTDGSITGVHCTVGISVNEINAIKNGESFREGDDWRDRFLYKT